MHFLYGAFQGIPLIWRYRWGGEPIPRHYDPLTNHTFPDSRPSVIYLRKYTIKHVIILLFLPQSARLYPALYPPVKSAEKKNKQKNDLYIKFQDITSGRKSGQEGKTSRRHAGPASHDEESFAYGAKNGNFLIRILFDFLVSITSESVVDMKYIQ